MHAASSAGGGCAWLLRSWCLPPSTTNPSKPSGQPCVPLWAAQVVTLEALLKQGSEDPKAGDAGAAAAGSSASRAAQGLTYVTAAGGRLWSAALRMDSQRAEGASERTIRCAGRAGLLGLRLGSVSLLGCSLQRAACRTDALSCWPACAAAW